MHRMFLNKDMALSILQLTELQWKAYENFVKLTGDEREAERQTTIYMTAMLDPSKEKRSE